MCLAYVPAFFLKLLLLFFILAYLVRAKFFAAVTFPKIQQPLWASLIGVVGGALQGILGTGGPVFVIYLSEAARDKSQFRAAVIFILFACNVVRLCVAAPTGLLSVDVL